jgi:hypothetical protein
MTLVATGRFLPIISEYRVSVRSDIKALPIKLPVDPVQQRLTHRTAMAIGPKLPHPFLTLPMPPPLAVQELRQVLGG